MDLQKILNKNNEGVDHFSNGRYSAAQKTFRAALELLKELLLRQEVNGDNHEKKKTEIFLPFISKLNAYPTTQSITTHMIITYSVTPWSYRLIFVHSKTQEIKMTEECSVMV